MAGQLAGGFIVERPSERSAAAGKKAAGDAGNGLVCCRPWRARDHVGRICQCRLSHRLRMLENFGALAGVEGLEPPTPGFGDRCSSH
jgi:hypothetical protein